MNDSKFIELLNLFLDREIAPEDAKLLEAEVLRSPQRRRVYREYCEMQKACVMLAEQASTAAAGSEFKNVVVSDDRFGSWRSWGVGTYTAGLCAAAACVALAVVVRSGSEPAATAPDTTNLATVTPVRIEPVVGNQQGHREIPMTVSLNQRSVELQPVFAAQSLVLAKDQSDASPGAAADSRFDWMNRVQMASLQKLSVEELVFETRPHLQLDATTFRGRRPMEAQFEKAAFQFQR